MSKNVEDPQGNVPVVKEDGTLTQNGLIVLQKLAAAVRELQDRVDALEAFHP